MPARINPRDWDHLFRPNTPRRGGPLWAFANVLIASIIIGVFIVGITFAIQYNAERLATLQATQVAQATSQAQTAVTTQTAEAGQGDPATAPSPLLDGAVGVSTVIGNGGNVRSQPDLSPETVLGQVCPGDEVAILEQQSPAGALWYRVRVIAVAANPTCQPAQPFPVGREGWVNSTLLNPPSPVPANGATPPGGATDLPTPLDGLALHATPAFTSSLRPG